MKVLIIIERGPRHSFLIKLHTEQLKREIRNLVARRKNPLAIAIALSKGRFEKEVTYNEIQDVKADLLLSENNVSWDLTDRRLDDVKSIKIGKKEN